MHQPWGGRTTASLKLESNSISYSSNLLVGNVRREIKVINFFAKP
jgi:hypothetical protein